MNKNSSSLFQSDIDWENNACLNFTENRWELYAEGYREAANQLVEYVQNSHTHQDDFVYPIVFNYRQYLELSLKDIILLSQLKSQRKFNVPITHKLDSLWDEVRKFIEANWPSIKKVDLDKIENLILEFSDADKISMAFRYPIDKDGNTHLQNIKLINLRNLKDLMKTIYDLLDGVACMIRDMP